jgi:hypothetical protein
MYPIFTGSPLSGTAGALVSPVPGEPEADEHAAVSSSSSVATAAALTALLDCGYLNGASLVRPAASTV